MKFKGFILIMAAAMMLFAAFRPKNPERFMKGNMHTHSYWSDGNTWPEEVVRWYSSNGYQFLAMTDHNLIQEGRKMRWTGTDSVKLRELEDFRKDFEKPGEFILIKSEEITDKSEKKPVHLNGFNLDQVVKPTGGAKVGECLNSNVKAIRQGLLPSGNPEWISVNHPNFGWALTADHLAQCGARYFEVYNGHPSVNNYGDSAHPSTEAMWDEANKWRVDHSEPLLLGTATDDAHQYDQWGVGKANPGRGWVMVRAADLTPAALYEAMFKGDFYASTGIVLKDFSHGKKSMSVLISAEPGVTYVTEFIGWMPGKDHPEVLARVEGTKPSYKFGGKEYFVRARITSSKVKENPFAKGDFEMAWLQPVVPEA
jgi:hypothetical protein